MLFSSLVFLFTFLPITLLVYYLVPRKVKNVVLLIASLIFYAWGEPVYILIMFVSIAIDYTHGISILFNYFCGMDIALKAGRKSQVRSLIFTIVVNLFILGFFKYYGFIVTNLNAILPFYIPYRKLELPIGISFYTFQTLSYIIDVYRGNVDVQVNLIDFGTYVTMFPQLIAGPIVQYADVERQLRERKESLTKFGYGAWFFVIGLAKKVLLANTIGSIYENIAAMDGMSVVTAWLGCLAYTFQIYFDFSGYSDMAIGLGKMLGFHVTIMDDREDFVTSERFPDADRLIKGSYDKLSDKIPAYENAYYVIVTRGHLGDSACARQILRRPYTYLGMIGSKNKVKLTREKLLGEGFSEEQLNSIHAPIGLPIGGHMPAEIAVSIAAEIVQEKNRYDVSYIDGAVEDAVRKKENGIMITIISKSGSSPRGTGSKMFIDKDGNSYGSIGGGNVEFQALKYAPEAQHGEIRKYNLSNQGGANLGMICGGEVEVLYELL